MNFVHPLKDAWSNPWFLECEVCGALLRDYEASKKHSLWHARLTSVEPKLGNWDTV